MTTHKDIVKALNDLGAKEWTLEGNDIANIVWLSNDEKTEAEIKAALGITADEAKLLLS